MRIDQLSGITGVYNKNGVNKVNSAKQVSKKDAVSISGSGQDFNTVMKALREVPDIRQDKVQEISQKIENGEYNVSGKDIAEKLAQKVAQKRE